MPERREKHLNAAIAGIEPGPAEITSLSKIRKL